MAASADNPVSRVVPDGNRRASLVALRDRLAAETDDVTWAKHKRECVCVCGMGDGRLLVALAKQIAAVMAEIDGLPETEGKSELDKIVASVAELDDHRKRRAPRGTKAAGS